MVQPYLFVTTKKKKKKDLKMKQQLIFCRPQNGGRFCVGRRMKFRSCNTEPCPQGGRDFREEQCSVFNGRHFNINGLPPTVRWVPKYSGSKSPTTQPGCCSRLTCHAVLKTQRAFCEITLALHLLPEIVTF